MTTKDIPPKGEGVNRSTLSAVVRADGKTARRNQGWTITGKAALGVSAALEDKSGFLFVLSILYNFNRFCNRV
jgi:hypothetical protein